MQLLFNFLETIAINTYLHSKQEKNWGNMTSCNPHKNFVRERIELFIGIYIYGIYISMMKSTFPFNPESSAKMVKTSKFVSQKQNKTKQKNYVKQ